MRRTDHDARQKLLSYGWNLSPVQTDFEIAPSVTMAAWVQGRAVPLQQAIHRATSLLQEAIAPVMAGLHQRTVEAQQAAIHLARQRGVTLALPRAYCVTRGQKVWWQATQPDPEPPCGRVAPRIVCDANPLVPFQRSDTDAEVAPFASQAPIVWQYSPDADRRVVSVAHRQVAARQTTRRAAVYAVSDAATQNLRGLVDQILWLTGVSPLLGSVTFSVGTPQPSLPLEELLQRNAVDLLLHVGSCPSLPESPSCLCRIKRISFGAADPDAEVSFVIPPLTWGIAGRVILPDATVCWLCEDPTRSPADPLVALMTQLGET